jgi:hypothetical protein
MSTKNSFMKGLGFFEGAVVTMIGDAASGDSQCTRSADSAEAQSDCYIVGGRGITEIFDIPTWISKIVDLWYIFLDKPPNVIVTGKCC